MIEQTEPGGVYFDVEPEIIQENTEENVTDQNHDTLDQDNGVDQPADVNYFQLNRDKERRSHMDPNMYGFGRVAKSYMVSYALVTAEDVMSQEPSTFKEATTCSKKEKWN